MQEKALITSASNKFFPSLLNLLGSIHANYPGHPVVHIYDLGLSATFRKELELIEWVRVLDMPRFVSHWRSCYTWKTHILSTPLADFNFYLDAGTQVQKSLDEIFEAIRLDGYFAVEQDVAIERIVPQDYKKMFRLTAEQYQEKSITAGIFGFAKTDPAATVTRKLYEAGVQGLCLGFSKEEQWKNTGLNKNPYIRNCDMFRHDTTLLSLLLKQEVPNLKVHDVRTYGATEARSDATEQFILNMRMNYSWLPYLSIRSVHRKWNARAAVNRLLVYTFLFAKRVRLWLKFRIRKILHPRS